MVLAVMSHTIRGKQKLLARVRRIRGQVEAIERALDGEAGCEQVMLSSLSGRLQTQAAQANPVGSPLKRSSTISTSFLVLLGSRLSSNENKMPVTLRITG